MNVTDNNDLDLTVRRLTMAYIYQISFDIGSDQMDQVEIGASLERILDHLRQVLPKETGFISSRAMYSLNVPDKTHLVLQSMWENWDDMDPILRSGVAEDRVLSEFRPHISPENLSVHIYEEVA
jgi:hypothetical protein